MTHITNPYRPNGLPSPELDAVPYPSVHADRARELIDTWPAAGQTPLIDAQALAERLGVSEVWIKDERLRMGLGSFKALGAAYVIARDAVEGVAAGKTYITASAGNHGISVAFGAQMFDANAVIYLSDQVPEGFAARLRDMGADVVRAGHDYEASMAAAAAAADAGAGELLSDSSWAGYMNAPYTLMEGYLTLMDEVFGQIPDVPTHIFLQAGVGGLAGAAAAAARSTWGDAPRIVVVEPDAAPALMASVEAGGPVHAAGPVSHMGRLDCKEPSFIALKGLSRDADDFMTISEDEGAAGAEMAAQAGYASTTSGAAGLAGMLVATSGAAELGLDDTARVLLILSEQADD